MTPLLLFLCAIAPGIAISIWIYHEDKYEKEPVDRLMLAFFWGCLSTIPAIMAQMFVKGWEDPDNFFKIGLYAFFVIALSEELSKFFYLRYYAYPDENFNEPFDGIVYAVMIGMGFATLENILYVLNTDGGSFTLSLGRAITAVPAHAAFAIMMGSYVGLAKFVPEKRNAYMISGLVLAIFFHGIYDFFLLQQSYKGLTIVSILILSIAITLARKLIRMSQDISPFKEGVVKGMPILEEDKTDENQKNEEAK
jgi:protease PrsW